MYYVSLEDSTKNFNWYIIRKNIFFVLAVMPLWFLIIIIGGLAFYMFISILMFEEWLESKQNNKK